MRPARLGSVGELLLGRPFGFEGFPDVHLVALRAHVQEALLDGVLEELVLLIQGELVHPIPSRTAAGTAHPTGGSTENSVAGRGFETGIIYDAT